jgi:hypothetical protein
MTGAVDPYFCFLKDFAGIVHSFHPAQNKSFENKSPGQAERLPDFMLALHRCLGMIHGAF